ncbi:MAG: WYL domain-containing protein, partial [Oscillospiraceae bacterium]
MSVPADSKSRILHTYKYLLDNTDEDHPATIKDITAYLNSVGIEIGTEAGRKTISDDIEELQACGFDVIKTRSTQNQYFIGSRTLELSELKMLVDAV